ncbi:MAG TPA: GNAT family N-acetyltransferase [Gaiellaceae bacterium]|nr:GNAT family N-acetyltransferase [Gaiellaceae bacterium]
MSQLDVAGVAAEAVDVILRDGGTLRLRPATRADSDGLIAFFSALSAESRSLRFHGARRIDEALVEPYLDPDWAIRGSLVASLARAADGEAIVALASYVRLDATTAEMAFSVADGEQGRGIGTRLLEQLAARARDAGITAFIADVMASNAVALSVFAETGFEIVRELEHGEIELRFPIAATGSFSARVEERDHTAVVASLRPFFTPGSVAVIGASRRRGSIGGELFRNILGADFTGAAYPVNLKREPVAGVHAFASIEEIPEPVDLAVICLPAGQVLDAASAALRRGVRALCVISAGFAETGGEGSDRQERLLAIVRAHGARLVGPNCLGIAVPGIGLNATFAPRPLPPGRIGFSSQSGALGLALLEKATERSLGFSSFISIGNKADVSSNDLLEWWEDDDATSLVLLYLESFGNPRAFARVARRLGRSKPILALKAGSTSAGSRAARSHTAALASSDTTVDALFHQAGVLRARTLEELLDAAALLSSQPLPQGRRVGVITNAGGLGILCADACEGAGLELPELAESTRAVLAAKVPGESSLANPVDLLGSATAATYEAVIPEILADPNVDALIVLFVPPVVAGADDVAAAIRRAVEQFEVPKPVIAVIVSADGTPAALRDPSSPVVALPYPESAARALAVASDRAEWLQRPPGVEPAIDGLGTPAARALVDAALARSTDAWLDPGQTRALLETYGIPLVPERLATTVEDALAAARELGFPSVVKTAVPGAHKTETGGVALDLRSDAEVRKAVERIGLPVIVQPLLSSGCELLAGTIQDPVFGPLVAFGPGGANAELIGDAAFRLAPLTDVDVAELIHGGKAGRLVAGFRGAPATDPGALADLLHRLGRLTADIPELAELDLNPVLGGPDGCVAVDARIRLSSATSPRRLKSW